jgi:hypothetical protein
MKITDLQKLDEAPMVDPVKQAQDALQQAKDGVVSIQDQMRQLTLQKKSADEQVRAATLAVAAARKSKAQQAQQPDTMGAANTTGSTAV